MNLNRAIVVTAAILLAVAPATAEGEVKAVDIVKALQGSEPQLTRSLSGQTRQAKGLSDEHRQFLRELPTRGLKVEKISKAGEIIDENDLPSLDIEIVFDFDSSKISPQSVGELEALGAALNDQSLASAQILLNGHTDAKGEARYNLELSQRRADEVKSRLISEYGISANRLVAIGFGEQRLKKPEEPEAEINRRVEVVNIGPSQ